MNKFSLTIISFVMVCPIGTLSQNIDYDALEIGLGTLQGTFDNRDSWVPGQPLYFTAGPFKFKNTSEGFVIRQESDAIVWSLTKPVEGPLRVPHHVSVGLDRFSIRGLAEGALANCNMSSVYLPGDIRTIPARCFEGCDNLKSITFHGGLKFIENGAFRWTRSLEELQLPSSVKFIGEYAFDQSGLVSIEISKDIETIGQGAFRNCKNLKSVTFSGHRLGEIQGYSFENCESLQYISLPPGIHSILSYAFKGAGLRHIVLPYTIEKIYSYAFIETAIVRIDCHAVKPPATGKLFTTDDAQRIELHVPRGSLEAYKESSPWKYISTIIADL